MENDIIEGTDTEDGKMRIAVNIRGKVRHFLEVKQNEHWKNG